MIRHENGMGAQILRPVLSFFILFSVIFSPQTQSSDRSENEMAINQLNDPEETSISQFVRLMTSNKDQDISNEDIRMIFEAASSLSESLADKTQKEIKEILNDIADQVFDPKDSGRNVSISGTFDLAIKHIEKDFSKKLKRIKFRYTQRTIIKILLGLAVFSFFSWTVFYQKYSHFFFRMLHTFGEELTIFIYWVTILGPLFYAPFKSWDVFAIWFLPPDMDPKAARLLRSATQENHIKELTRLLETQYVFQELDQKVRQFTLNCKRQEK